jgi:HlyD family secretion protein
MSGKSLLILIVFAGGLAVGGYALWNRVNDPAEIALSGIIEADDVHVGSKVGGRVLRVVADEGQKVKAGDLLVVLEADEFKASLAEAQGVLKEAQAKLAELVAGYRRQEVDQAKADWLAAKTQYENAERFRVRMKDLVAREMVAHQEYDDAKAKAEGDEQRMGSAKEKYDMLVAGSRKEEIDQARARVEAAQAKVALLKTQLDETVVKAPVDAVVEVLDLEPGDLVGAGKPLATLLRTQELWVRAYLPEDKLGYARPELRVKVRVDSFPKKDFSGVVRRVHRQAEFTPRNVQTPEERVLQVFQIEVVVEDPDGVLRPGMNADVYIPK